MVSVQQAYALIVSHPFKPEREPVPLKEAVGRVLDESVFADRDFPPFDRVAMDGIAVSVQALQLGQRSFPIEGMHAAGTPQKSLHDNRKCLEVMTGAILPHGADVVIKYEDLKIEDGIASLSQEVSVSDIQKFQNVHRQGQDCRQGDELLEAGVILSPAEIALLASVGKATVVVRKSPYVAVVSTGDELVDVTETPALHQIRRSNSYALQSALQEMKIKAEVYHLSDNREVVEEGLKTILEENDVIILSGGVSKGKFDYVPTSLEKAGVKKIFHGVTQRPGKPFWFGISDKGKVVFALPGNPVSTFMCFYRFVKPWLLTSLNAPLTQSSAILASDFAFKAPMTYFLQVKIKTEQGSLVAYPAPGGGSGDFANLRDVDGFLELPAERTDFKAGEAFPYIPFRK